MPDKKQPQRAQEVPSSRKRYTTPKLEEYGHVAKLTQSGGSTKAEMANPKSKMCL